MEYTITGRYIQGMEVVGYFVLDESSGKEKLLRTSDVIKLSKSGKLNADCVIVDNKEYLFLTDDNEVRNVTEAKNKMSVLYKVKDTEGNIVSYFCEDTRGKSYRIKAEQFWEVAANGLIDNVKASICHGKRVIKGIGFKLTELPVIDADQN